MGYSKFKKRFKRARAALRHNTIHKIWEYGKYYGPGWSGGKHQNSIDYAEDPSAPPPVDDLDRAAMIHDAEYARARKRGRSPDASVDFRFAKRAMKTGTVRGVVGGAAVGLQGVYRYIRSKVHPDDIFTRPIPASPPPEEANNLKEMHSRLGGRFQFPKRKVPRSQKQVRGVQVSREYQGSSAGVHTVALGVTNVPRHGATNIDSPWYLVGSEILKMILRKHYQADVSDRNQLISTLVPNLYQTQVNVDDDMPRLALIRLWTQDTSKTTASTQIASYTTINMFAGAGPVHTLTKTFHDVASEIGTQLRYLSAKYTDLAASSVVSHVKQLYGYSLENVQALDEDSTSKAAGTTREFTGIHRLDDKIVSMFMTTKIRIQNTTGASYGGGTGAFLHTTDAIEANPLVGKVYYYNGPKPKMSNNVIEAAVNGSGELGIASVTVGDRSIFAKDTDLNGIFKVDTGASSFGNHIPTPQQFLNVNRWAPVSLRPGEIKTLNIQFKFDGFLNKLIEGLAYDNLAGTEFIADENESFGSGVLFCFEEYLGTSWNTTDPSINIQYEINRFAKCKIKKSVRKGMELIREYAAPVNTISMN